MFKTSDAEKRIQNRLNDLNCLNVLNNTSAMDRHKGKNLRGVEDAVHGHEIVIGVLEADIPRAVINRLNAAEIK